MISGVRIAGAILGFAGAALDFYSGNLFLAQPTVWLPQNNGMGMAAAAPLTAMYPPYQAFWAVGLFSLGTLLVITSLLSLSSFGMRKMRSFGAVMMIYGVVMIAAGVFMYNGSAIMTDNTSFLSGFGMLVIGALMLANGGLMSRSAMKVVNTKNQKM